LLSIGSQESKQLPSIAICSFISKAGYLVFFTKTIQTAITSENYLEKTIPLQDTKSPQKISYLFSKSTSWDIFYELQNKKENKIGNQETLLKIDLALLFPCRKKK
jgi:hypothetical protein